MKKSILFVLLSAGWYKYVSSDSVGLWVLILLLLGSAILIFATIRAHKKILAAQNVVAAAATFQTLSEEQKSRVHDHAINIVLRGGWRGRGAESPSFGDDAEKFGWYALSMHECGIEPVCLVKNWNFVRNPFTQVFIEDACIAKCIEIAERQGHEVKLLPRTSIFPATDSLSTSSDLSQPDSDDHSSTSPTHIQVQAETICRANQIWFLSKIECNYPMNVKQITLLKDRLDWTGLSRNDSLAWSETLVAQFEDYWDWDCLSGNKLLPWSEDFICRYKDRLDWAALCYNTALPWSDDFINKFKDSLDWSSLSAQEFLPWSEGLIARFNNLWSWEYLSTNESLPWSESFISLFEDRWDWGLLSSNKSLPWSEAFIAKYQDRWYWRELSQNQSLPWSDALISLYEDRWHWGSSDDDDDCEGGLCINRSIPWTESLIVKYENRWDWMWLSCNQALPWSVGLISRYEDRWNWSDLSGNEALPWSDALISHYERKWDWNRLTQNESLPWSDGLVSRYEARWSWESLSRRKSLPWSETFIARYEDRWDWGRLRENGAIQWSESLISRFEHKFNAWRNKPIEAYGEKSVPDVFSNTPIYLVEGIEQPQCFNLTKRQVDLILDECIRNPQESSTDWAEEARNRRAAEVRKDWLKKKVSRADSEEKQMVLTERLGPSPVAFGFQNRVWLQLLSEMEDGDELWEYTSDSHYWENLAGRTGIAVVRKGEVIDCITTKMN